MWLQIFLLLSLAFNIQGKYARKLPLKENWELDAQLKILNKPPVNTIKKEHGEIFDCVDIYKQPAFENPLLKGHKLQVKPSFMTKGPTQKSSLEGPVINFTLKGVECPMGTVLIKRTTKQDLIRAKYAKAQLSKYNSPVHLNAINGPAYHDAGFSTYRGTYYGTRVRLNIWNPKVESYQYTQIKFYLRSWAPDEDYNSDVNVLEVGWMIDPSLFGDFETHLYGSWTADSRGDTGCYNTLCPGYVQTSNLFTLGAILKPYSKLNQSQTEILFQVSKDEVTHNWWLLYGLDNIPIGYWPKELFTGLSDSAKQVVWGGEARTMSGHPFPPMGSGNFPITTGETTYIGQIQLMSDDYILRDVKKDNVFGVATSPKCYKADEALGVDHVPGGGYGLFVGGPGGNDC